MGSIRSLICSIVARMNFSSLPCARASHVTAERQGGKTRAGIAGRARSGVYVKEWDAEK